MDIHNSSYLFNKVRGRCPTHKEPSILNVLLTTTVEGMLDCILAYWSLALIILLITASSLAIVVKLLCFINVNFIDRIIGALS